MRGKKTDSIYEALGRYAEQQSKKTSLQEKVNLNETIRRLRRERSLSGVELCRRSQDLDPRTLTAIEKGRIKNPSVKTLQSIARGLGVTISEIFRRSEMSIDRHFYLGSQKGNFQIDFPWRGVKAVSFTPFMKDFFCGKLILTAQKRFDETILNHPLPLFVSMLVGRIEVEIEGKKLNLKEGDNLFFNGILRHSFYNPLRREAVLLLVTAPSFL